MSSQTGVSRDEQAIQATTPVPYQWYGPYLQLEVIGVPKPKGSLKHVGRGRMTEQVEGSPAWKADVIVAARRRIAEAHSFEGPFPLAGPLAVDITVSLAKPASAPKLTRSYPTSQRTGDGDKHERNIWDGLKQAGAIADDSLIVDWSARKVWVGEHPHALDVPGAVIYVYRVGVPRDLREGAA